MAGETEMHKLLKKEACRWLYRMGYRCIAAEVRLSGLGIVDAVGTGLFRPNHNYLFVPQALHQTCFIECKASRADFLRDVSEDGQLSLALMERAGNRRRRKRRKCLSQRVGLGKFAACLAAPMANLHYVLAPAGMLTRKDLPGRWGLLSYGEGGIHVVVRPDWQEQGRGSFVESAVARTLTMDIYRADDRAMDSVNRQIINQQMQLADRIRQMRLVVGELREEVEGGKAGKGSGVRGEGSGEGEEEVALGVDARGPAQLGPVHVAAPEALARTAAEGVGRGIPARPAGLAFRRDRVAR